MDSVGSADSFGLDSPAAPAGDNIARRNGPSTTHAEHTLLLTLTLLRNSGKYLTGRRHGRLVCVGNFRVSPKGRSHYSTSVGESLYVEEFRFFGDPDTQVAMENPRLSERVASDLGYGVAKRRFA